MTGTPLGEPELPPSLPPSLRFLKRLVTALTVTMILGVITLVGLLVTRLPQGAAPPALPESLVLPGGTTAAAVTMGTGWIAVVTTDNHILIFGLDGKLLNDLTINIK